MTIRKNIIVNICKLITRLLSIILFYDFDKEVDKKIIELAKKNNNNKN